MMITHAALSQGICAIEKIVGRKHDVDHDSVLATEFSHPYISMVGPTKEQCVDKA